MILDSLASTDTVITKQALKALENCKIDTSLLANVFTALKGNYPGKEEDVKKELLNKLDEFKTAEVGRLICETYDSLPDNSEIQLKALNTIASYKSAKLNRELFAKIMNDSPASEKIYY